MSIISLVSYMLTKVAATVYDGVVVSKDVFSIDSIRGIYIFRISAISLVVTRGIYIAPGGLMAVIWTSVIQAPGLLSGSIAVFDAGLIKVAGWDEIIYNRNKEV